MTAQNQELNPRDLVIAEGTKPVQPIVFTPYTDFTTFSAEVAVKDGDLVFHFYVTDEVNKGPDPRKYWLELFPTVLEKTAKDYFKADFPQLKAAYTEEKASWWLEAKGFGMKLSPYTLAERFFDRLDAELEAGAKNISR
jgi:hypothetical protein